MAVLAKDLSTSLLRAHGKGWNASLVIDTSQIPQYLCKLCHNICKNSVVLTCDHDEDDAVHMFCKECLAQKLEETNHVCPLDSSHQQTGFHSNRFVRNLVLKLKVN